MKNLRHYWKTRGATPGKVWARALPTIAPPHKQGAPIFAKSAKVTARRPSCSYAEPRTRMLGNQNEVENES